MNLSIFRRLVWKEYRLQRSLWIAMTALTAMLQLLVVAYERSHADRAVGLYLIAVALPAFYALGCGATLFAGEREAETYEFQRSLPVHAWSVLVGKAVLALASAAAMLGLMVGLATFLSGSSLPNANPAIWHAEVWATFGFFGLEMFLWAVLFSLLTRRVLLAAILGVTAASIGAHIAAATIATRTNMNTYWEALPLREAIAAIVALADIGLAARWFREKRDRRSDSARSTAAETPRQAAAIGDPFRKPQRMAILGRLVWQHWRQSRRMTITMTALLIPLLAILVTWLMRARAYPVWFIEIHAGEIYLPADRMFFSMQLILVMASVPLLGMCAFLADQRRSSYRFLTDRGVAPRFVWLSRLSVTIGFPMFVFISLLLALFLLVSAMLPSPLQSHLLQWVRLADAHTEAYALGYLAFGVLGYAILGIAAGQFCSMCFRSPLLAGLFSVLLTGVLTAWCVLMLFWQINWLWSILPIPAALLLATRLRTADWLLERNGPRAWVRPGLALLVPIAALFVAVPLYRAYSIPMVDPGFSPDEFAQSLTAEEQTTLGLYEQASRTVTPRQHDGHGFQRQPETDALTKLEIAWVDANQKTIATLLKASRRNIRNCPDYRSRPWKWRLAELASLLVCGAARSEEKGDLDTALDQYLAAVRLSSYLRNWYPIPITTYDRYYNESGDNRADSIERMVYARLPLWAARKGQTPERIVAAARQLERLASGVSPSNGVKLAHLQLQQFLSGDFDAFFGGPNHRESLPSLTALWFHLPWERARAERLLNCLTRSQLNNLSWAEEGVRQGMPIPQSPYGPNVFGSFMRDESEPPYALHAAISAPPIVYDARWGGVKLVQDYTALVTARRAVRVVLALEAWKLKHGSLPKTLDELVGTCLDRLPADPCSGKPFRYFRDGLGIPLPWSQPRPERAFSFDRGAIAPNVPFLWASGAKLRCTDPRYSIARDSVLGEYDIFTNIGGFMDQWRHPDSEYDIWESGWPFAIP